LTVVDPVPIVHPASQGGSTGGMEYPTLITGGTRWLSPAASRQPEAVTVHEVGHQFWYGVVATNEVEHAWLDEGLNTYAAARVLDEAMPGRFVAVTRYFGGLLPWAYEDVRWSRDIDGNRLAGYRAAARADVPATPTWQYWPGTAGAISYDKTAVWLATLERHLGWPVMQRVLATYFERGAFRHPGPDEFFATAQEVSGRDLRWFFDQVHRSTATFDYAVTHVQLVGTYDALVSTVVIGREGDGVFPIDIRVRFEDGVETVERWDGRDRRATFTFARDTAVTEVEIDPDRVLLLDLDVTNNSWTSAPRAADAASLWSWRWLAWVQELLLTYAVFA
jgi:aminopeptidase N